MLYYCHILLGKPENTFFALFLRCFKHWVLYVQWKHKLRSLDMDSDEEYRLFITPLDVCRPLPVRRRQTYVHPFKAQGHPMFCSQAPPRRWLLLVTCVQQRHDILHSKCQKVLSRQPFNLKSYTPLPGHRPCHRRKVLFTVCLPPPPLSKQHQALVRSIFAPWILAVDFSIGPAVAV